MSDTTDIATTGDNAAEIAEFRALYNPDLDFRKLVSEGTDYAQTFRLVEKAFLVGVPFVIINVVYRPGYVANNIQGDYVSCECVVADADTLNSMQVQSQLEGPLKVYPNQPIVFNDGGTGVRRTLTELFHNNGLIDVGHEDMDRRFDLPFSQWKSGADLAQTGIRADIHGNKFRFVAINGLRVSEYESPFGPAVTYYIG